MVTSERLTVVVVTKTITQVNFCLLFVRDVMVFDKSYSFTICALIKPIICKCIAGFTCYQKRIRRSGFGLRGGRMVVCHAG